MAPKLSLTVPGVLNPASSLWAADPGDEIPPGPATKVTGRSADNVAEVNSWAGVNTCQFNGTTPIEVSSQIDHTSYRRGGDAGPAEDKPSTQALATGCVVYRNTRIWIRIRRDIGYTTRASNDSGDSVLVRRSCLKRARSSATSAPARLAG